ncbi:MAG: FAD-binding protein [Flavobacteriales bacterium]|nr:FAD-binding protein [Flavobacteriales bacterium]
MIREADILITPHDAQDPSTIRRMLAISLHVPVTDIYDFVLLRQSIDARGKTVKFQQRYQVFIGEHRIPEPEFSPVFKNISNAEPVHIIGAGPAGLFAAIQLIALGKKPIIIERGKDVKARRRDLALLTKQHIVNPESNYCFGEGGAGTYSDGKLYTRSDKRGDIYNVLKLFHYFGAPYDILVNARPHIGTNKLPDVIVAMREFIKQAGGEIHFEHKLEDIHVKNQSIHSITVKGITIECRKLILATGHSARDIFRLLHHKKITIEAKPFALGVRAEHPQALIDKIQYHCEKRSELLPPSYYNLVTQAMGRGVYSFCMCPGGIIAPCATNPGEVVTNGWSPSKRNNPFANSGIVVEVKLEDIARYTGRTDALAALDFQASVEQKACIGGPKSQIAPAQRMTDFCQGKVSTSLPDCSYLPGIGSADLHTILPPFVAQRLQVGFIEFGKKMKGYYTQEAILVAPESRTSSPVRIPRDKCNLQHPEVNGLFPCGEGAGYAGGIVSAAIDGMKCASESAK